VRIENKRFRLKAPLDKAKIEADITRTEIAKTRRIRDKVSKGAIRDFSRGYECVSLTQEDEERHDCVTFKSKRLLLLGIRHLFYVRHLYSTLINIR